MSRNKPRQSRTPFPLDYHQWVKVEAPMPWRPKASGDMIEGEYMGAGVRSGSNGEYPIFIISTQTKVFLVSGVKMKDLITAANILPGVQVRVVFEGMRDTLNGNQFKDFSLYVKKQ